MFLKRADASLMGLPPEIRLQILRDLLCQEGPLRDIPHVIARNGNADEVARHERHRISHESYTWWLQDRKRTKSELFGSQKRFQLSPQILRVCKQLLSEGFALLYDDKTIGISFLSGFNNFSEAWHPLGCAQWRRDNDPFWIYTDARSYCLGEKSLAGAFRRWPALRRFNNFEYTLYLGPGEEQKHLQFRSGRDHDLTTLHGIHINTLTIRRFNAAAASYSPDYIPSFFDRFMCCAVNRFCSKVKKA